MLTRTGEKHFGLTDMFKHIGGEDHVVVAAHLCGNPLVKIGLDKGIDAIANTVELLDINASHLESPSAEQV